MKFFDRMHEDIAGFRQQYMEEGSACSLRANTDDKAMVHICSYSLISLVINWATDWMASANALISPGFTDLIDVLSIVGSASAPMLDAMT